MLALLLTEQVGYVMYQVAWNDVHEQMEAAFLSGLNEDELEPISYTENQHAIEWQEPGVDFYFRNNLYDVVQKRTINGKTWFYCIKEKHELELIEKYAKTITLRPSNDIGITAPDFLGEYILKNTKGPSVRPVLANTRFSNFDEDILLRAKDILLPPPRWSGYIA